MEKYFELPSLGDLFLEHTFYSLDGEPVLFVCKDTSELRYLCSCCQMYEEWVVGQISESILLDLIDDKVTIRGVFEDNCDTRFFVTWDGEEFHLDTDCPYDALPKAGAKLELRRAREGTYRKTLEEANKRRKSISAAIDIAGTYVPLIVPSMGAISLAAKAIEMVVPALTPIAGLQMEYLSTIQTCYKKIYSNFAFHKPSSANVVVNEIVESTLEELTSALAKTAELEFHEQSKCSAGTKEEVQVAEIKWSYQYAA